MKRRAFIVGLAAAPWWIGRAFGDASVGGARVKASSTSASAASSSTSLASSKTSRPTLVLVVPSDQSARWSRGAAFGELLNHGRDRDLAPLALVDVVCAPARDYGLQREPLMLLVAGDGVRALNGVLPEDDAGRIELLGTLIREVLPLEGKSARELAAAARERYVNKAPRGSRWGRTTMCGNEYEEGPAEMVDCGMGHVGAVSRRFLDFYTGTKR